MDKLSERLWVMRVSLENLTDDELATFDEAIEKAKRYEDAPVAYVLEAEGETFIPVAHKYVVQRVRLVVEGGEG